MFCLEWGWGGGGGFTLYKTLRARRTESRTTLYCCLSCNLLHERWFLFFFPPPPSSRLSWLLRCLGECSCYYQNVYTTIILLYLGFCPNGTAFSEGVWKRNAEQNMWKMEKILFWHQCLYLTIYSWLYLSDRGSMFSRCSEFSLLYNKQTGFGIHSTWYAIFGIVCLQVYK
jgi:hypothetical protein